jgi:hypothetical protein
MSYRLLAAAAALSLSSVAIGAGFNNALFVHHFDQPIGAAPGDADYANGSASPVGTGGQIVSSPVKYGTGALDHKNVGGTLTYPTAGNFNLPAGTVEMWVNTAAYAGSYGGLFAATIAGNEDIRWQRTAAGKLEAYMYHAAGSGIWWVETNANPPQMTDNEWHHIAWTWDFAADSTHIYIDGQVADTARSAGALSYSGGIKPTFEIGTIQNGSAGWNGWIDDFRISDIDRYHGQNFTPPGELPIPEPGTLALVSLGGLAALRRRR